MLEIHHFSYGWITPVLAYIMSVIGSLLGLRCTARARNGDGRSGWLISAAIAIGGTGIWVMHFVAMLGFSIHGAVIRYNVPQTLLSALISVTVVWIGLYVVAREPFGKLSLFAGGAVTGLGVGAMHYSGMYAMKSDASIGYNPTIVTLSMVIAVVAATVALWFTLVIKGIYATIGAALIMGVAVCGMHYTGMASMSAHRVDNAVPPHGAGAMELLAPLMITVSMVTLVLLIHVGLTEVDERSMMPEPVRPQPDSRAAWSLRAGAMPVEAQYGSGQDEFAPQDYRTAGLYPPAADYPVPGRHSAAPDYPRPGQYQPAGVGPVGRRERNSAPLQRSRR
ncbi:MHYT domain-containing protein [Nocardia sp. CDC153]|uniref:MHYT domain-containing protein n=1 Tax=Nocardia sp. CDC153 TaxID=3112167 RepID=UPI002DBB2910|nr:MHYT domain-containing protein [Nocardia sp. CDC153]MEC3953903.1 MHYT domain-containing protein [Nocardia sp. CDC153]